MARFFNIDLSQIPPPDIIETLSFETLRTDIITDCAARLNAAGIPYNVQSLESDPFVYLCEAYAARELQLRARVNDACKAVLLASSWGTNLDNIGAAFATPRSMILTLTAGGTGYTQPTVSFSPTGGSATVLFSNGVVTGFTNIVAGYPSGTAVTATISDPTGSGAAVTVALETDAAYQQRIHQAPDAFASAGPTGGYEYWANTLVPGMLDVSAVQVSPGTVQVTLLAPGPTYQPTAQQIQTLGAFFIQANSKPLTDVVVVAGPYIVPVTITATLALFPGPDQNVVLANANTALAKVITQNQKLGRTLAVSVITAALQQNGVQSVHLTSPTADVTVGPSSAWNVTSINISPTTATTP